MEGLKGALELTSLDEKNIPPHNVRGIEREYIFLGGGIRKSKKRVTRDRSLGNESYQKGIQGFRGVDQGLCFLGAKFSEEVFFGHSTTELTTLFTNIVNMYLCFEQLL